MLRDKFKKKIWDQFQYLKHVQYMSIYSVFLSDVEIMYWSLDPMFVSSNPTEVDEFFSRCESHEHKSSRRD